MVDLSIANFEGVVIRTPVGSDVVYLIGGENICTKPLQPFDEQVCDFLSDLSKQLATTRAADENADVNTFGFWCRRRHIDTLKEEHSGGAVRLGRGLMFHITPANVPVNFAYSFAFSLLAGNANIIRVPTQLFPQVDIICRSISDLFERKKYSELKKMNAFVRYDSDDSITGNFSSLCDGRIIWGGDQTIQNIRRISIPARSVEITFADRYSFCVMDSEAVVTLGVKDLRELARRFYNDTYLMDQNACSTPHLVVWIGPEKEVAKKMFWPAVRDHVKRVYEFDISVSYNKYSQLCHDAINLDCVTKITRYENHLYRLAVEKLPLEVDKLRGKYGYFFEHDIDEIDTLVEIVNHKYQTLTYFGIEENSLRQFVVNNRLLGIDRVVPVGRALDMEIVWDGYDIVRTLSRVIGR